MNIRRIHACTGHRAAVYALAPGRDERHFLSAGGDGWIVEWNLDDPETGKLIANTESNIFSLCRLPGGRHLVAGNMHGGIHWIDVEQPEQTRLIQAHRKGVFDLLLLSDQHLLSAGGDGILTLWDIHNGQPMASLQLSHESLRAIAYAPWRNELAVGASDGNLYFLDAGMLALKGTALKAHGNSVFSLAYSEKNRLLLSGGRDAFLRVWEADHEPDSIPWPSSKSPALAAHLFTINHIAFSPDGRHFATASRDKTIKIWDADAVELLKVVDVIRDGGHINSVNRLLWMGNTLVSASDDRSMLLWALQSTPS